MKKYIAAFIAALLCLGCTLPFNLGSLFKPDQSVEADGDGATQAERYDEFTTLIEEDEIVILEIKGSETNWGFTGPVMDLVICNNGDQPLEVEIPCGLIFSPGNEGTQRMMVVQALFVRIPAGESVEVQPFVVCIDSSKSGPSPEDSFTVGSLADGDLLQIAECLCREDLSGSQEGMDLLNVQYAVWAVADENAAGEDVSLEEFFSQMGSDVSPEQQEQMQEYMNLLQEFDAGTNEWLEKCGIELPQ